MSVYSMTGYASAQHNPAKESAEGDGKSSATSRLGIEIRAVNSRFLDLSFRLPEELRACEPALREKLNAKLKRGKVELRASIESTSTSVVTEPSTRLLQRLNAIQDHVKAWLPSAQPLSVAEVIRLAGDESQPGKDWQAETLQLADEVLDALMAARKREGTRLAAMLFDRIQQLRALAAQAEPLIPLLVTQQRQRFLDRWAQAMELTDGQAKSEMAQDRALTEATAFAIRIDVAEELTRLASHLDELERLVKKGGDIGKRLDFLIQELHREANTLGSKSAALELTHISVDMKVLIEQMREQVQNIE
ncbi:YicC/YloC family endoribonuclease [Rhodoferax sp. BLA1]|uniref:YicC/YloC family endoribonuclease n=1 Tax=Rhodoferax sp. BLA1 TaxID=2576062 RepID=UPI0015D3F731|nr:YicC/YloC family endoribonuclease [Rhodoferax sp. BLA1]